MMGSPSSPMSVGLGSTTASLDTGQLGGLVAWQGNTSININQSHNRSQMDPSVTMKEKNWPALLILVIILLTIGGNILVILAVSLEKKLQNATNFFLRSLAVADILVGILVMPISLINILYDYAWPLPSALCPIWIYLDVLFSTASIMHLCAISLDRYVAIRNPIEHSRFNSRTKAMMKIAAVWTISIVISMPIPVIGLLDEEKVFVNGSCVLNEERFMLVGSFVAFFIPLIIMVVTYCLTVQVLQRQASDLLYESKVPVSQQALQPVPPPQTQPRRSSLSCLKLEPSLSTTPSNSISVIPGSEAPSQFSSPGGRDMGGHGRRGMMQAIKNERRASKVLGVVFFLFLVMWCPFFITNVMYVLCRGACNESLLGELLNVFVWVGYISSGINPLVYTLFNKTYRRAFSNYMRCHYPGAGLKPHSAHPPCPSYTVTPTLPCGKESVDRNSNCHNGEGSLLGGPEADDMDDRLELRPEMSEVSINSSLAPGEHTSFM
ncbi:5-hydroxytryptamine receptor 2A-like [Anguilla anguilla]|nr:5-hydroxytryptamine receptor 2A-like [Anguilla anguilla]XP_035289662.1 5-hydroxytryptamine receptor 2A-like [Anguilla anguilla]XP_035289663.1 5-hydroxytryptamine receptor 2A-like [Anguilla anguilla]XP_035289664.1 5-hydroxytryptamine receptor 2A-like [Anguilla anguilla]XP_035289665.1 5-hydroxytryptamine receptor 2A-like [Anguilla anguilla]